MTGHALLFSLSERRFVASNPIRISEELLDATAG
jgi:hypothetical protein